MGAMCWAIAGNQGVKLSSRQTECRVIPPWPPSECSARACGEIWQLLWHYPIDQWMQCMNRAHTAGVVLWNAVLMLFMCTYFMSEKPVCCWILLWITEWGDSRWPVLCYSTLTSLGEWSVWEEKEKNFYTLGIPLTNCNRMFSFIII